MELISVGSGNGKLEREYIIKYQKTIICVDPDWQSFLSEGLTRPFWFPQYNNVPELLEYEPDWKNNCVLILN